MKTNQAKLCAAVLLAALLFALAGCSDIINKPEDPAAPNHWDILYENGTGSNVDRLWFLRGSPILITRVTAYSRNDKYFPVGSEDGQIGNINVNSVDLISETLRQAGVGLSIKWELQGHIHPTVRAAMLKAAAKAGAPKEEKK
jgi:hypothetical protein